MRLLGLQVIDYKLSELRSVELLDDLCEAMASYTYARPPTSDPNAPGADNSTDAAQQEEDSSSAEPHEKQWLKFSGEGAISIAAADRCEPRGGGGGACTQPWQLLRLTASTAGGRGGGCTPPGSRALDIAHPGVPHASAAACRPAKAEQDARAKELASWCAALIEKHEEAVLEALQQDGFADGVAPVLCGQLARKCSAEEAADGQEAAAGDGDAAAEDAGSGDREL